MTVITRKKLPTRVGDVTVVPPLATEILVSWRNDEGQVEWWKAIVAEVTTLKKRKVMGLGVLVYESRGAFKDYVSKVESLYNERNGRTVREVGMKSSECAWKMEGDDTLCTSDTSSISRVTFTVSGTPPVQSSENHSSRKHPRAPADDEHTHHHSKQQKVVPKVDVIEEKNDGDTSPTEPTGPVNVQLLPSQFTAAQLMTNVTTEYVHVLNNLALKTNSPTHHGHVFVLKAEQSTNLPNDCPRTLRIQVQLGVSKKVRLFKESLSRHRAVCSGSASS